MANTFKNAGIAIGTSRTTLYTCPAATQTVIHALYISNVDGVNDADVTVVLHIVMSLRLYLSRQMLPCYLINL